MVCMLHFLDSLNYRKFKKQFKYKMDNPKKLKNRYKNLILQKENSDKK